MQLGIITSSGGNRYIFKGFSFDNQELRWRSAHLGGAFGVLSP